MRQTFALLDRSDRLGLGRSVGYEASCGVKPERGRVAGQDPHDYRTRAVASQLLERGLKKRSPDVLALVGGAT